MGTIHNILSKLFTTRQLEFIYYYTNFYKISDVSHAIKCRAALKHMKSLLEKRPICVSLETHSNCNSKCIFCVRRKLRPSNETMTMELFEKICSDYASIGAGYLGFSPLLADPLLDPLLIERIKLIRNKFQNIVPHIFTNAIALKRYSDNDLEFLLDSLDHIDISIGGFNENDYMIMFSVNQWKSVSESLSRLARINNTLGRRCELSLHIRTNKKKEILISDDFKFYKSIGFKIDDVIDTFSSWCGMISKDELPDGAKLNEANNQDVTSSCFFLSYSLMIMPNGKVLACGCMDGNETTEIGNIINDSISNIYLGEKRVNLIKSFSNGKLPNICLKCSYYNPLERAITSPDLINYDFSKNFWDAKRPT